jgi:hypothetical protein
MFRGTHVHLRQMEILVNGDASEPTEQRVPVGPHTSSGYREWKSFYGTEVRQVPVILSDSEEHGKTRYYTLYSTPNEGYLIHETEVVRRGRMERQLGQSPAEVQEVGCRLYSEEELLKRAPRNRR